MRHIFGPSALAALCLGAFLSGRPAMAQSGATGSIGGKVVDGQGAVLPGATVTATTGAGTVVRSGQTDLAGKYELANIPAGSYTVTASLSGFTRSEPKLVAVTAGAMATVDATQIGRAHV